jgi:ABC-2 type transport system permease protein
VLDLTFSLLMKILLVRLLKQDPEESERDVVVNSSPAYTAMFAMFSCTWGRAIKKPGTLLFAFIQPLYWIVFFGFLFERYPLLNSDVTLRYLDFLAPGVCVMALLFGASQSGIGFIRDLNNGLLLRILLTPAPLTSVLFGKILADTLRLLMNAMGVGLMAMAMGARLNTSLEVFGFTVMILFVFGCAILLDSA